MKLLVVSPVPTDPLSAGNRARVLNLFSALEQMGHDATFAYVPYEYDADLHAMAQRLQHKLEILDASRPPFPSRVGRIKRKMRRTLRLQGAGLWDVDEWFDHALIPQIVSLQKAHVFDTVLIEYVFLSKLATVLPKSVRTVIDTHDLFGSRDELYSENRLSPTWFATTTRQEIRALKRASAVIAIQPEEADYLKGRGCPEVFTVGHIPKQITPLPDPGGLRLLFVGSGHSINIQGLERFVEFVLPQIRAAIPNCELAIAGPAGHSRKWPDSVLVLGEIESISTAYSEAAIAINPVAFGTGLAVKTVEALSYGKPVVATVAGARGLGPEFASALSIAQNDNEFARMVIALLGSKAARAELSRNAIAAISVWKENQLSALDAALRG